MTCSARKPGVIKRGERERERERLREKEREREEREREVGHGSCLG
jgi:hypothetical protein